MGMAASQARLLSLTARLHDVEYKAQNVMSQKIALATQKDGLYKEYCDALEATEFKVAYRNDDASTRLVDANYNSVCTYNPDRMQQLYALRDNNTGKIIVSQEVADNYECYGNDKYAFAYAMLGFDNNYNFPHTEEMAGDGLTPDETGMFVGKIGGATDSEGSPFNYVTEPDGSTSLYMTECEELAYEENKDQFPELEEKYNAIFEADMPQKQEALDEFREELYNCLGEEIFDYMNMSKSDDLEYAPEQDYPDLTWSDIKQEFNYYVNLWSAINGAGGCQVVDSQYTEGEQGNTWFQNMLETGLATLMAYDISGHKNEWTDTSVATSTNNNYIQEVSDDTAVKKAEAKYEHELEILNRKDTKFDTELSKLETERKSITTEMESIEKVRDDNIDRTFGIFS